LEFSYFKIFVKVINILLHIMKIVNELHNLFTHIIIRQNVNLSNIYNIIYLFEQPYYDFFKGKFSYLRDELFNIRETLKTPYYCIKSKHLGETEVT
jgi:hypothetical protein